MSKKQEKAKNKAELTQERRQSSACEKNSASARLSLRPLVLGSVSLLLAITVTVLLIYRIGDRPATAEEKQLYSLMEKSVEALPFDVKDYDVSYHQGIFTLSLDNMTISAKSMALAEKEKIVDVMRNYRPFIDIFKFFPASLVLGDCAEIKADAQITLRPDFVKRHANTLITVTDKCFGRFSLAFNILNIDSDLLASMQHALITNSASFTTNVSSLIYTDRIKVTYIPASFINNYQRHIAATVTSETAMSYIPLFLDDYQTRALSFNLKETDAIINKNNLRLFLNSPDEITATLALTAPAPLKEALRAMPAATIRYRP